MVATSEGTNGDAAGGVRPTYEELVAENRRLQAQVQELQRQVQELTLLVEKLRRDPLTANGAVLPALDWPARPRTERPRTARVKTTV